MVIALCLYVDGLISTDLKISHFTNASGGIFPCSYSAMRKEQCEAQHSEAQKHA